MIAQTVGAGMGGDDGFCAVFQHVPEPVGGNVGHIHRDAQPVHLRHDLAAEHGQPAFAALFVHAVGNIVAVAPYQGHAAHAQFIIDAQHFQTAVQRAAFFNGQQRIELPVGKLLQVFSGQNAVHVQSFLLQFPESPQVGVNQLQRIGRPCPDAEHVRRDEHGHELEAAAVFNDPFRVQHQVVGV